MIGRTNAVSTTGEVLPTNETSVIKIKFAKTTIKGFRLTATIKENGNWRNQPRVIFNNGVTPGDMDIPGLQAVEDVTNSMLTLNESYDNTDGALEYLFIVGNIKSLIIAPFNGEPLAIESIYINDPYLEVLDGVYYTSQYIKNFELYDNKLTSIGELLAGATMDKFILDATTITDIFSHALFDCTISEFRVLNLRVSLDISDLYLTDESIRNVIYSLGTPIDENQVLTFNAGTLNLSEENLVITSIIERGWKLHSNTSYVRFWARDDIESVKQQSDGRLFNFIPSTTPPPSDIYTKNIAIVGFTPIYVWLDGIDIKYYSNATIYLAREVNNLFQSADYFEKIDLSKIKSDNIINLAYWFSDCNSLQNVILTGWNTSKVKSMEEMFNGCTALTTVQFGNTFSNTSLESAENMFNNCTLQPSAYPQWTNGTWDYSTGTFTKS